MTGATTGGVLEEVKVLAGGAAAALEGHLDASLRPAAARILTEAAAVAIRAAAGEDTTTARIALEASTASLAREAKVVVELEGRQLALRAAFALIARLATAG